MTHNRFPIWSDLAAVYAVIVTFVYGWTAYWFVWNVPSWTYYLTLKEISLLLAYSLAVNLIESALLLAVVVGLFIAFSKQWLNDGAFVLFGCNLSVLMAIGLYFFGQVNRQQTDFSSELLIKSLAGFLIMILLSLLLCRVAAVSGPILAFADRAKVFLYLTLPAGAISLLIVLARLLMFH